MKTLKLMLVTLLAVFGFNGANAAELVNSTQYGTDGYQYVIKSMTKGTDNVWTGTVSLKKNVLSGTSITVAATTQITVEGQVGTQECAGTVTFKIVEIEPNAFKDLSDVTTITFAEGCNVEVIGAGAFAGTKISDLNLTKTKITKLEKLFEDNNVDLKTVELPATLTELADNALANCIQLEDVDFALCTKLNKLGAGSLSNTVVDEYDFSTCEKLVNLGASNPFVNATTTTNKNLATVTLPLVTPTTGNPYCPVTAIGTAFANCEVLATIANLEVSKITTVVDKAFENDKNLTSLEFPLTLTAVNASPFVGCAKLATLIFNNLSTTPLAIGNGANIYGAAAADLAALNSLQIKVPAHTGATKNASNVTIADGALVGCTGITDLQFAVGEEFGGVIGTFALKEDADATITFGDFGAATYTTLTGPKGVYTSTLTMGVYNPTTAPTTAIVDGVVSSASVGEIKKASVLTAIGQAQEINFTGNITTVALAAPGTANAALTTINFGAVNITTEYIAATVFNGTNAPNLTDVTWTPAGTTANPATKAFAKEAFGAGSVGTSAKVTLHTTAAVGFAFYENKEANLYNVIFDAAAIDPTPQQISVYGTASSTYFYGFVKTGTAQRLEIEKMQNDEQVTVYSAFVDEADQKIYMDPLALSDGKYVVATNQVVVVRLKNPATTTDLSNGGKKAIVNALPTTAYPTMRTMQFGASDWHILNDLQLTDKVFSSDYIGTTYVGKTLYAMKNPATEGQLTWAKVAKTSYLPQGAVFVETAENSAARLEVVWLDGDEATAILNKMAEKNQDGAIYNLQGVRVKGAQKGVYIQNGKKYIVK